MKVNEPTCKRLFSSQLDVHVHCMYIYIYIYIFYFFSSKMVRYATEPENPTKCK